MSSSKIEKGEKIAQCCQAKKNSRWRCYSKLKMTTNDNKLLSVNYDDCTCIFKKKF